MRLSLNNCETTIENHGVFEWMSLNIYETLHFCLVGYYEIPHLTVLSCGDILLGVIKNFADKETEKVFEGKVSRRLPPVIQQTARRKLIYLDEADSLLDLRAPPGNRLEALKGSRAGQHSIRINDQWRICFRWHKNNAYDVEITDYH